MAPSVKSMVANVSSLEHTCEILNLMLELDSNAVHALFTSGGVSCNEALGNLESAHCAHDRTSRAHVGALVTTESLGHGSRKRGTPIPKLTIEHWDFYALLPIHVLNAIGEDPTRMISIVRAGSDAPNRFRILRFEVVDA